MKLFILALLFNNAFVSSQKFTRKFKNSNLVISQDRLSLIHEDDELAFFVLGDWGGIPNSPYRTLIELEVSKSMNSLSSIHNTKFQIALGDNFYFDGVTNVNDKRFKETFEDVFDSESLVNTPWFFIAGNHDHYGNASAQLSYMNQSTRWIFPNYNYTVDMGVQDKPANIKFLFIDTVLMCGNTEHEHGMSHQPLHESEDAQLAGEDYFKDLEAELKSINENENVDYLFVAGHFPVWSIAEHGPTKCLVSKLRPLLHKYKVTAYLSGHDHNLQHIQDSYLDSKVDYILSGAACFINNSTENINKIPKGSLKYHYGDASGTVNGGFTLFKAHANNLTVTYFNSPGLELYQTTLYPRE